MLFSIGTATLFETPTIPAAIVGVCHTFLFGPFITSIMTATVFGTAFASIGPTATIVAITTLVVVSICFAALFLTRIVRNICGRRIRFILGAGTACGE